MPKRKSRLALIMLRIYSTSVVLLSKYCTSVDAEILLVVDKTEWVLFDEFRFSLTSLIYMD